MKPFKMFFGLAIGVMLFLFLARVFFAAFIFAVIMSIIYGIYRRLKDFVSYDRFGEPYHFKYINSKRQSFNWNNSIEPLFYESLKRNTKSIHKIHIID